MRKSRAMCGLLVGLCLGLLTDEASCQSSPFELATTVVKRWTENSEADFVAVFPFQDGRDAFSEMTQAQFDKKPGLASVIQTNTNQAVLLVSGVPLLENSGDATIESRTFSGVYKAHEVNGRWALEAR